MIYRKWILPILGLACVASLNLPAAAAVDSYQLQRLQEKADSDREIVPVQLPGDELPAAVVILADDHYQVTTDGHTLSDPMERRQQLHLRGASFDPLQDLPRNTELLNLAGADTSSSDTYIVQFKTQALADLQKLIESLGGRVYRPMPHQALLVRMDADTLEVVRTLPLVRWVGEYRLDHKMAPAVQDMLLSGSIDGDDLRAYRLLLLSGDYGTTIRGVVELNGGQVLRSLSPRLLEIEATAEALLEIAARPEVEHLELWTPAETDMDLVREFGGADFLETVRLPGYSGSGVRAEVLDDGVFTGHADFQARPPVLHGTESSDTNHGTSVYGIVFGDGTSDLTARGMLPDAEQPIVASYRYLGDRDAHTARLVDPEGPYRAVFQTNSWGHARTRDYTSLSALMDEIIFNHDLLITQSQSNAGNPDSRPEAWAKNIVSVGGFRHYDTLDISMHRWEQTASIGPAADGRIKPDLAHFYDRTWTTSFRGGHSDFGGTSGATPITAGHFGLLFELWADGVFAGAPGQRRDVFASRPSAATAKALMINTTFQYPFAGAEHDMTRVHQGWGTASVRNLYERAEAHNWELPLLVDESQRLLPMEIHHYALSVEAGGAMHITLVYKDPAGSPSAGIHRVNDLSLRVTAPDGTVYWGNNGLLSGHWSSSGGEPNIVDTVENVFIQSPMSGIWTLEVRGDEVVQDAHLDTAEIDAVYSLVASGGGIVSGSSSSSSSSSSSAGAGCPGAPTWHPEEIYTEGQQVEYQGVKYQARWWSSGNNPETYSGPYQVWEALGECGFSRASSSTSSSTSASSLSSSSPSGSASSAAACSALPTWSAEEAYNQGQEVVHQGVRYQARWYVRGVDPEAHSGPYEAWINLGEC